MPLLCLALFGCAHTIRIVDESGCPVKGAKVSVLRYSLSPDPVQETNSRGKFSIPSIPGTESITVTKEGYETFVFYGSDKPPKKIQLKTK